MVEQAKARAAYKLKNCRVRLGRYSNQICFQCASQATTCQQMGQSPSPSQDCSRVCLHGHKGKSKERQIRKSDIPRSQGTQPKANLIGHKCPHTLICIFIGYTLLYALSVISLVPHSYIYTLSVILLVTRHGL